MSRYCSKEKEYAPMIMPTRPANNCICDFPTLVILILIVLQFSKHGKGYCHEDDDCCDSKSYPIGNGILFIIALFYLSCAGCGTGKLGGFGGFGGFGGCGCGAY